MRKSSFLGGDTCLSMQQTDGAVDSNASAKGTSDPPPSQKFTNTILQYKEQIKNMRSYLKELENDKENELQKKAESQSPPPP